MASIWYMIVNFNSDLLVLSGKNRTSGVEKEGSVIDVFSYCVHLVNIQE